MIFSSFENSEIMKTLLSSTFRLLEMVFMYPFTLSLH